MHFLYLTLLSTLQGCLQHWQRGKTVQYLYLRVWVFFKETLLKLKACISKGQLPMGLMFLARHV